MHCGLSNLVQLRQSRPSRAVTIAAFLLTLALSASAQNPPIPSITTLTTVPTEGKHKKHKQDSDTPAVQPNISIPVAPLGFAPPAPSYLGDRIAQVSLDFLDEDTLLFTFRVPGLIPREEKPTTPGASEPRPSDLIAEPHRITRTIRAVVLTLPTGAIAAEALWRLHDYSPYLWMLNNRHFLLRDRDSVQTGDATLALTPFLRFPGPVRSLEVDPTQHLLVANSTEIPVTAPDAASSASTATNPASLDLDHPAPTPEKPTTPALPQDLMRVLNMDTRSVVILGRGSQLGHLPIDGPGYYDALRGRNNDWTIVYTGFDGDTKPLQQLESSCFPALDVVAANVVLASACNANGRRLTAINRLWDRNNARLWETTLPANNIWPRVTRASQAPRLARETLEVTRLIGIFSPFDGSDVRSQIVQVYDLADGKVEFRINVSPILDNGGNFTLSPSGRRFAVLNNGAIQVYDLPPAPPIPATPAPPLPAAPAPAQP